jgi:hypothetical protein
MIDPNSLLEALEPKLKALNIDANHFASYGDFMVFDAYPEFGGDTYRMRLEVDTQSGTISPLETYLRVKLDESNHDDVDRDHTNTPKEVLMKGLEFSETIKTTVAELAPTGPRI